MKPEQQRIAIAEACGLKCSTCNNTGFYPKWGRAEYKRILAMGVRGPAKEPAIPCDHNGKLPDYLNDLNAMHEAERVLDFKTTTFRTGSFNLYRDTLQRMTGRDNWGIATAAQRCEAFLRTLNLWDAKAAASVGAKQP